MRVLTALAVMTACVFGNTLAQGKSADPPNLSSTRNVLYLCGKEGSKDVFIQRFFDVVGGKITARILKRGRPEIFVIVAAKDTGRRFYRGRIDTDQWYEMTATEYY